MPRRKLIPRGGLRIVDRRTPPRFIAGAQVILREHLAFARQRRVQRERPRGIRDGALAPQIHVRQPQTRVQISHLKLLFADGEGRGKIPVAQCLIGLVQIHLRHASIFVEVQHRQIRSCRLLVPVESGPAMSGGVGEGEPVTPHAHQGRRPIGEGIALKQPHHFRIAGE